VSAYDDIAEWYYHWVGTHSMREDSFFPAVEAFIVPQLTAEVFLLADNALSHPQEIAAYLAALQALPQFEHLVIPIGKGLSIAYRQEDNEALLGGTQFLFLVEPWVPSFP